MTSLPSGDFDECGNICTAAGAKVSTGTVYVLTENVERLMLLGWRLIEEFPNGMSLVERDYFHSIAAAQRQVRDVRENSAVLLQRARDVEAELEQKTFAAVPDWSKSFQDRTADWALACFGEYRATANSVEDAKEERNHRMLEEALELVQALGCSREAAHRIVDYVFDRPPGEPSTEVGNLATTLVMLCWQHNFDFVVEAEKELARMWQNIEKIRDKQLQKPYFGSQKICAARRPLPLP